MNNGCGSEEEKGLLPPKCEPVPSKAQESEDKVGCEKDEGNLVNQEGKYTTCRYTDNPSPSQEPKVLTKVEKSVNKEKVINVNVKNGCDSEKEKGAGK